MKSMVAWSMMGLLAVSLVGCGSQSGYATPQEAYSAVIKGRDGDWQTALTAMTPKGKNAMVLQAMLSVGFSAGADEEKKKEVEALLKKHGLTKEKIQEIDLLKDKEAPAKLGALVKDKASFIKEAFAFAKVDLKKGETSEKLSDLKIDGDEAKAKVKMNGNDKTINFKKIDGRWYCEI